MQFKMLQLTEIIYIACKGNVIFAGTPATFVRLAGCNLACDFCNTDYSLKFLMSVEDVVARVREMCADCP